MMIVSKKSTFDVVLQAELVLPPPNRTSFLLERTTIRQTMAIQTWVFGRYFLENEQSESFTLRKTTDNIYHQ